MAVLPESDRLAITRAAMALWSDAHLEIPLTNAEIKAGVDAVDTILDNSAAALNAALPEPFKSAASAEQKAFIVAMAALARYNPNMVRKIARTD